MLDVEFQVSWPDLTVTVLNPDSLPVARRIRRDQMRALLAERYGATARHHARPDAGPSGTGWCSTTTWLFPLSDNLVGGASYQFALGAQVAGGGLEVGVRSLGTLDAGATEFAATWKGVWIDNKYVKQLTLGTTTLTGPRYAGVRGVAVTNSPYVRPNYVGQLDYYGRLEPGWQLEAYSGAQLVAFDSIGASGDYSISLPVGYGENPVDFIAYGPTGQVRRFNQTYRVVSEQLPYKQLEYGIAAGECIATLCNGALNADLHYGLSRRVTVRGGVEGYSRDGLSDLVHPYAVATGLIGNALTLEGEAVGSGWLRGAVRLEPSLNFRLAGGIHGLRRNGRALGDRPAGPPVAVALRRLRAADSRARVVLLPGHSPSSTTAWTWTPAARGCRRRCRPTACGSTRTCGSSDSPPPSARPPATQFVGLSGLRQRPPLVGLAARRALVPGRPRDAAAGTG